MNRLLVLNNFLLSLFFATKLHAAALETPKALEKDVKFWEKVFTDYSPNECIYHDSENLDAIFANRKVPINAKNRNKIIDDQIRRLKAGANVLAKLGRTTGPMSKKIYQGTPKRLRNKSYWESLGKRLRCQRGVDLSQSFKRSNKHLPMIIKLLEKNKIPLDLKYLPYLESGFHTRIRSKANARGLWQIMPSVARRLGLKVNRHRDDRTNPYRSTIAAIKLLKKLKKKHKKWPLAITAYNYGSNGMARATKKYGYDYIKIKKRHKTSVFGFAVKNYYPSLLATRNVVRDIRKGSHATKKYKVRRGENLTLIAKKFKNRLHEVIDLNHLSSTKLYPGQRLKVFVR